MPKPNNTSRARKRKDPLDLIKGLSDTDLRTLLKHMMEESPTLTERPDLKLRLMSAVDSVGRAGLEDVMKRLLSEVDEWKGYVERKTKEKENLANGAEAELTGIERTGDRLVRQSDEAGESAGTAEQAENLLHDL